MDTFKPAIRTAAQRLGFVLCGVARVTAAAHAEFVRQWLAAGNAATMRYIERGLEKRLDPRLVLPEVCSVVAVGYPYAPAPPAPIDWREQMRGRIAAYAFGADYHVVMERKLEQLAAEIRGLQAGVVARAYVDTGPVLEREWAASGGVGWFGKSTNLLHTEHGSWLVLGEILTNLELEPDTVQPDRCGRCTRGLDRCPTAALKAGYVLDARLCISYLTIEHRGAIPRELRAKMGNWIFGCDVCQEVCPWDERLARRRGRPAGDDLHPYLPELLLLSDAQFAARFRASAVRRAKRAGLARNVAVALGNTRNPAAVGALQTALRHDPTPLVRAHAAWALGEVGDGKARDTLAAARVHEAEPEVRAEIDVALAGAKS